MRIAHLILAHNKPEQLKRLINRIMHHDADIYIHLDGKTAVAPFLELKDIPNVFFVENRVKVYWGSYSIVVATVNGIKQILFSGRKYGYINLLSGQDYPLRPIEEFHHFLSDNPGRAFMNTLVAESQWLEALPRVQQYHLNNYHIPGRFTVQATINMLMPRRKLPNNLILAGRSQWFTVSSGCARFMIKYWDRNPVLRQFIKLSWAPDEFIFQTILYNSPYRGKMVDEDLRYIDWSGGGASPKALTTEDIAKLIASGKYFARKFDEAVDAVVLDYLDEVVQHHTHDGFDEHPVGVGV